MDNEAAVEDVPILCRKRYFVIFLSYLGFVNMYSLRINLSVAIIAMTKNSTDNDTVPLTQQNSCNATKQPESDTFNWNSIEQGFALSAFFYGEN